MFDVDEGIYLVRILLQEHTVFRFRLQLELVLDGAVQLATACVGSKRSSVARSRHDSTHI